jgi:hypothetical protein
LSPHWRFVPAAKRVREDSRETAEIVLQVTQPVELF